MNLEKAFITLYNSNISRSIKRDPARGSAQGDQLHMLFQKDHELASLMLWGVCGVFKGKQRLTVRMQRKAKESVL
jgi:hypothetical protein